MNCKAIRATNVKCLWTRAKVIHDKIHTCCNGQVIETKGMITVQHVENCFDKIFVSKDAVKILNWTTHGRKVYWGSNCQDCLLKRWREAKW